MPLAAALTALLAGALLLAPRPAHAAFPGRNGPLIELWWPDFVVGPYARGSELRIVGGQVAFRCAAVPEQRDRRPCDSTAIDDPAASPDGRTIVFDDGAGLATVGVDGSGYRTLPRFTPRLGTPSFSPDGRRLVGVTGLADPPQVSPNPVVSVASIGGGHPRRLAPGERPSWSTRGWIAFIRDEDLYRIRPDGTHLKRLTWHGCTAASWSPDGRRIACARDGWLVTMAADGRDLRRITIRTADGLLVSAIADVAWSPDGRSIAVTGSDALTIADLRGRPRRAWANGASRDEDGGVMRRQQAVEWAPAPRP